MYEEFFGLSEKPFSIQPDPSFLYWGRGHRLAYAMLEYGVLNHAGISVITGEVGCGKTTLIHRLLDQLSDTHTVSLLSNIQQGRGDLLSWVLMSFGQPFAGKTHVELFAQLQTFFIGEYAKGRRVVLIIDEAQNLSVDMLEELRMLSNINAGKDQLLQLILVGQPQLKDLLNHPDMLQLAQRVGSDFHLTPLSREEVGGYLETRLTIAGARRRIFTDRAVDVIAEQSTGIPRVINIIADTALVYAFSSQDLVVDVDVVRNVVRDKMEFGVFGYATRGEAAQPARPVSSQMTGPTAFIKDDQDSAGETKRPTAERPAFRTVADPPPDAPRMPSPRRATPRLVETRPSPVASASAAAQAARSIEPLEPAYDPPPAVEPVEPEPAPAPPRARPQTASAVAAPRVGVIHIGPGPLGGQGGADEGTTLYVAEHADDIDAQAAAEAGADIVEFAGVALSPGRARNAGYRQIKKSLPELRYVQFVEPGVVLAPGWLETAVKFMERRPEVAVIEGAFVGGEGGPPGEVQTSGSTMLVRAEAFEAAGGYRGDLSVNETDDLCIRLRRRGAHVWRLDAPMAQRVQPAPGASGWWGRASRDGYRYAHGARLHGAPPERLYVGEHLRTLIWGAALPFAVVSGAVVAGVAAQLMTRGPNPALLAGAVLAAGAAIYLARILYAAVRAGKRRNRLVYAVSATLAHVPEVFGAWRFYASGDGKRAQS